MSRLGRHSAGKTVGIPKMPLPGGSSGSPSAAPSASPPSPAPFKRSSSVPRTGAVREAFVFHRSDASSPSRKGSPPTSPVKPLQLPTVEQILRGAGGGGGDGQDGQAADPSEGSVMAKVAKCACSPRRPGCNRSL